MLMSYSGSSVRASVSRCLALIVLGLSGPDAWAQSASISGYVTDRSNGQALELVNVIARAPDGAVEGAVSNRDGQYLIPGLEPGRYVVSASFIGYETYTDTLGLLPGQAYTLNIDLNPGAEGLDEVVVETERTSGAARVTAGQQTVRPADIELVPSPDLSADLVGYLTTIPGVVATGDRGGQLFIRGGEPSQNLVLVDGIPIYQPFHILGFYSAFPAEVLNRTDIYAGGFGSKFGGRVSSVIDVATRNGNDRSFAGSVSASPFISSVALEGPIIPGRASFLASIRKSVIARTDSFLVGEALPFDFGDSFLKLQSRLTQRSRFSITALSTYDRGTIVEDVGGVPPEEIRWDNDVIGARYIVLPRAIPVTASLSISRSRLSSEVGPVDAPTRNSHIRSWRVGLDATFVGDNIDANAGWEAEFLNLSSDIGGAFQNIELRRTNWTATALYLEPDVTLGRGFRLRPGIRAQFYRIRFDPYLEPRLRVVWERGIHQVSGAVGFYQQEMVGLNDRRDAASVFTAWAAIPRREDQPDDVRAGRLSRAVHAILGYRVSPRPWLDIAVEGFHKQMTNLYISEWTAFPRFTTRVQPANGRSFGFDLRMEARPSSFYAQLNYGYSNTIYWARQASIELWYGEESLRFRPPHDRRHQVNALVSAEVLGFDASMRWEFGSGLPFSRVIGFDGFILVDDIRKYANAPSSRRVIYERPYRGILPTYHRLDVSLEREFDLGVADVTVQGSLINVYDRRNIFYLDIFTLRRVDQLPFVPSLGIKVELQ